MSSRRTSTQEKQHQQRVPPQEPLPEDVELNANISVTRNAVVVVERHENEDNENENEIPVYHLVPEGKHNQANNDDDNANNDDDNEEDSGCLWTLASRILTHTPLLRKMALYSTLVSLLAMFIVGVVIVIVGEDKFEDRWKALGTCGAITAGTVVNLLLTIGLTHNRGSKALVVASLAGMIVTPIAVILGISLIWTRDGGDGDSEGVSKQVWKTIASFGLLAVGLAYISLTSFFRLAPRKLVWWSRLFAQILLFLVWLAFIAESTGGLVVIILAGVIVAVLSVSMLATHLMARRAGRTVETSNSRTEAVANADHDELTPIINPGKVWRFLLQATPPICIVVAGTTLTLVEESLGPTLATVGTIIAAAAAVYAQSLGFKQGSGYNQRTFMSILTLLGMFVATPIALVFILVFIWKSFSDKEDDEDDNQNGKALQKICITAAFLLVALAYTSVMRCLSSKTPKRLVLLSGALTFQTLFLVWLALMVESDDGIVFLILFGMAAALSTALVCIKNDSIYGSFAGSQNDNNNPLPTKTRDEAQAEVEVLDRKAKVRKAALLQLLCMPSLLLFLAGVIMTLVSDAAMQALATCAVLLVGSTLFYIQALGFRQNQITNILSILAMAVITPAFIAVTVAMVWVHSNDAPSWDDTYFSDTAINLSKASATFGLLSAILAYHCIMSNLDDKVPRILLALAHCCSAMVCFLVWLMAIQWNTYGFEFAIWIGVLALAGTLALVPDAIHQERSSQDPAQRGAGILGPLLAVSYVQPSSLQARVKALRKASLGLVCLSQLVVFCSGVAIIVHGDNDVTKPLLWTCASLTCASVLAVCFTFALYRGTTMLQRASTLLSFLGIFCFVPAATVCAIVLAWKTFRDSSSAIPDMTLRYISDSLRKSGLTFALLSAASAYFVTTSFFHRAQKKILLLANVAAFMLLFLVWLAVMVDSDGGRVVLIILAVSVGILSASVPLSHFQQEEPEVEPSTGDPTTALKVRRKACTLLHLSPLLAIFVAGILKIVDPDSTWPAVATAAIILVTSLLVAVQSLGFMNGEGRLVTAMTFLSIFGMTAIDPVSAGLAIAVSWTKIEDNNYNLVKWAVSFGVVAAGIAYLCLLSVLKRSKQLRLLATVVALKGLFLAWLAAMARSDGSIVVLIVYAVVVVLLTLATYISNSGNQSEQRRRQDMESELVRSLVRAGEVEPIPIQKTVRRSAMYLLIYSPFLALFVSGCITTFVDDCLEPVLQTSAAIIACFIYTAIQSLGFSEGSGAFKKVATVLATSGMVLTPVITALTIALSWKYHNDGTISDSFGKLTATLGIISTAISYVCLVAYLKFAPGKLQFISILCFFMTLFLVWLGVMAESLGGLVCVILMAVCALITTLVVYATDSDQRNQSNVRESPGSNPEEGVKDPEEQNDPSEQQAPQALPEEGISWEAMVKKTTCYLLLSSPLVGTFLVGITTTVKDDSLAASLMTGIYYVLGCICVFVLGLGFGRGPILMTSISALGMITTPIAYSLVVPLLWKSPDTSQFDSLDESPGLMKSSSTFGLLTVALAYVCWMSYLHKPPGRIRVLAILCCLTTIFLLWLGIMAESNDGIVVVIVFGVIALGLSCWLGYYQLTRETQANQGAYEEATEATLKQRVQKAAFFTFFCSPLVALFLAGVLSTLKGSLSASLAASSVLVVGASYMAILSFGFVPGEPGNYKSFLLLTSTLGICMAPVATGMTMKLVWDAMTDEAVAEALKKWTASLGLLATMPVYICLISLCEKAPNKLILLADVCSIMMFFFLWLSLLVENEEGLKVAICVGAFALLLTLLVVLIHIRRGGFGCRSCKRRRREPTDLPLALARTVDEPSGYHEAVQAKATPSQETNNHVEGGITLTIDELDQELKGLGHALITESKAKRPDDHEAAQAKTVHAQDGDRSISESKAKSPSVVEVTVAQPNKNCTMGIAVGSKRSSAAPIITRIFKNGACANTALQVGMQILTINGVQCQSPHDVVKKITASEDEVTIRAYMYPEDVIQHLKKKPDTVTARVTRSPLMKTEADEAVHISPGEPLPEYDDTIDVDDLIEERQQQKQEVALADPVLPPLFQMDENEVEREEEEEGEVTVLDAVPKTPEEVASSLGTLIEQEQEKEVIKKISSSVAASVTPSIGAHVTASTTKMSRKRFERTFVNTGKDPTMENAELYLESIEYGPLGSNDLPLTVTTYPGHRWFIVANGVYMKMFEIEDEDGDDSDKIIRV